jgi:hypothetical protein
MGRLFNEPVLIGTAVRTVILALVSFGFDLTTEQIAATMVALEAVLALVTRALVTPNQLAERRVAAGNSPTDSDKPLPASRTPRSPTAPRADA